jgi:endonuclease/exonuclease/phosphatase family metal-dependent hydrolase
VLLLQEVHRVGLGIPPDDELPANAPSGSRTPEPDRVPIIEWAQALGLHLVYVPSMRNGMGFDTAEDRGNAILSTLPLHQPFALELPAGIQRRVTVVAAVEGRTSAGSAWSLNVASAHLDNASLSSPLASLGSVRARQASGLVRMLPAEGPLVVGGDFNTWLGQREERAYRIMRDDFPWPREHQLAPTAQRLGAGRVIDWIFFRGPSGWTFDDARAARTYGSDHFPVYGWVKIPAAGYDG